MASKLWKIFFHRLLCVGVLVLRCCIIYPIEGTLYNETNVFKHSTVVNWYWIDQNRIASREKMCNFNCCLNHLTPKSLHPGLPDYLWSMCFYSNLASSTSTNTLETKDCYNSHSSSNHSKTLAFQKLWQFG